MSRPGGESFEVGRFWRLLPAGMRRRWWTFRPLDALVRRWPVRRRPRRLAVVRMDGIGDMVLFRTALEHYPEVFGVDKADIVIIGCQSWAPVVEQVFEGWSVHILNEHRFAKRPGYRFRQALAVRGLGAKTVVLDAYFRRELMADSLAWLTGAARTIVSLPYISGRTRPTFTWYLSQADEIIDTGLYPAHEVERHYAFLSAVAGRTIAPEPPRLPWRRTAPPLADGPPYVVLNPGSNEPGRRWPFEGYLEIARRLLEGGWRVVVVGVKDARYAAEAARLPDHPGLVNLVGKTGLAELFDLLAGAAAVVSNDSGPAHVAIALGTPAVVVVGGGHFGCFVPYPEGIRPQTARFVYRRMACYHCFWRCDKRTDPEESFPCVAAVETGEVWDALNGLLAAAPTRDAGPAKAE